MKHKSREEFFQSLLRQIAYLEGRYNIIGISLSGPPPNPDGIEQKIEEALFIRKAILKANKDAAEEGFQLLLC